MATAVVQEQQLLKTLRWYDGFVIALANPGFLLLSLPYSVTDLGGWGAAILWGISAACAVLINTIYSELATMFPEKSGGLALYAHEAWRKYTTLVGPIATFGYWIGWSVVLASSGLFIGSVIGGTWFPGEPGGQLSRRATGTSRRAVPRSGCPRSIAIGLILCVWLFNVFGARVGVTFGYAAGVLLMVPLFVMMILPFLNGSFDSANLTNKLGDSGLAWGGLQVALVWLWLMCWSAWGVDVCATFAPEYKDTVRDTKLALRSAALFSMVVYIVLPIGLIGGAGPKLVEGYDYPGAMDKIVGSTRFTDFFVVCLIASFIITMNTATADGGRALYGISRDGMTIKQLGTLNRFSVPGNAMTLDMVFNILLLPLRRQHLRHPRGQQSRLRAGAHVRPLGLRAPPQGPAELAATDQAPGDLDADRRAPRGLVPDPDRRRLRLLRHGGRRLRRHEGEGDRRRRARDRPAALLLPPARAGQGADPLARRDADDAADGRLVRRPDPLILLAAVEGAGLPAPFACRLHLRPSWLKNGRTRTAPEEASRHGA